MRRFLFLPARIALAGTGEGVLTGGASRAKCCGYVKVKMSKVYAVASASLGHTVVVPSLDCYTVGTEFANWLQKISGNYVFNGNGCTQDADGVLTAFSLEQYRTTGSYVGSLPSGALTVASYTGVEPNLPVDPVAVAAVFAGVFVPMVSLYLVGYAIRKVLHLIEGKG